MATQEFRLPDLGEGLTEAEIVSWLVKEGEEIGLNHPIVEVETEKALVEIPSPFAGTVKSLHGEVGTKMKVGAVLISIDTEGDAPAPPQRREVLVGYGPEEEGAGRRRRKKIGKRGEEDDGSGDPESNGAAEAEPAEKAPAAKDAVPAPAAAADGGAVRALATPPVRKLAKEHGVDIDTLTGTGPGGRVTREDVVAAAEGGSSAPAAAEPKTATAGQKTAAVAPTPLRSVATGGEERIPVRAIRRSIAERMVRSYTEIPHVTEWLDVDATELMKLRKDLTAAPEAEGGKISPLPVIVKALVAALRRHPLVNSAWDAATTEIVVKHYYNVGIATDTDRGLLVPVVRNADQMNVFEIAREIARLAEASRDHSITASELGGSTITITNVGSFGMAGGTPIINHPEAAILCTGVISKRPWVYDGQIAVRDVMTLGLSFDHRIIDGAEAGRFLRYLGDLIEKPARLFGVL